MFKYITKYAVIMGICILSCMLTGCATILSKPKGQSAVEARLAEVSPNESFTFISVERGEKLPKRDIYYYESDVRDFTIKVYSSIAQDDIQGIKLPIYYKTIYINYPGVVRQIYYDDVVDIIETSRLYLPTSGYQWVKEDFEHLSSVVTKTLILENAADIDEVVSIIAQVNEIYSAEIEYNGAEWTQRNPLFNIQVLWGDEAAREEHHTVSLGNFKIDGIASYDEIDEQLRSTYRDKAEEGLVPIHNYNNTKE